VIDVDVALCVPGVSPSPIDPCRIRDPWLGSLRAQIGYDVI